MVPLSKISEKNWSVLRCNKEAINFKDRSGTSEIFSFCGQFCGTIS